MGRDIIEDVTVQSFHPRVTNVSCVVFTGKEKELLKVGLNYAPPSPVSSPQLLELATHLDAALDDQDEGLKFQCTNLIKQNVETVNNICSDKKMARKIRKQLDDNNLILCKADKGNSITILERSIYLEKMKECISNMKITEISSDPTNKFNKAVYITVNNAGLVLNKNQMFLAKSVHPSAPVLYGLLKIHKSDVPVRPVSSSCNAPAQGLSKVLSKILPELINFKPKFSIKNSLELIDKTKDLFIPNNARLISFDVCNLFPSIPVAKLKSILDEHIKNELSDLNKRKQLMSLIELCIDQNYFQFDKKFYIQNDGLAMGSGLSPFLAEFFMSKFEENLLNSGLSGVTNILFWTRYVDDILCIWLGTERQLENFKSKVLNKIDENLQFTVEIGNNRINFLDLTLQIDKNKLSYNIFRKPTFSDVVIPINSCHPWKTKMAAFHCMTERLLKVPLNNKDFNKELLTIQSIAKNNGYKESIILNMIKKKEYKQAVDSIYPKIQRNENIIYRKIPYVGGLSDQFAKILKEVNIVPAFFNKYTLKNLLVNNKIKIKTDDIERSGVYKLNCNDCQAVYIGKTKRSLKTRFKEHVSSSKSHKPNSGFARHLKINKHQANIENMTLIHGLNGGKILDKLEIYEIKKELLDGTLLVNDQIDFSNRSPLLDPVLINVNARLSG